MEQQSTKTKILQEALRLFSEKGYEAVSVAEIAAAVGIRAPSLYKHYQSKQDIFDAILTEMNRRYEQQAAYMQMSGNEPARDMPIFLNIDEEQLIVMGKNLFLYFLHDEYVSRFRRMLTVEQYHNRELAALYARQYIEEPLSYQGMLLGLLMQNGIFKSEEADIMALHFFAPLYLLLNLCDCQPEREAEAVNLLEQHIRQFNRLYCSES